MDRIVAIPTHGPDLDARASIRLPHAPWLVLVHPDGRVEAHENPAAKADSHPGVHVAKFILKQQVGAVIGHHMGPHPSAALAKGGVEIYEGREGVPAKELLAAYRAGELARLSQEEVDARHGPHRHGHGHGPGHGHGHGHGHEHG